MHKTFHNLCTSNLGPKHVTEQELVREINTYKYRVIKSLCSPDDYTKKNSHIQKYFNLLALKFGI
jgi:hypothetical protein